MIRIIIIDDEPLARSIVAECIDKHPDLKVVAECGDGFEGVKAITQHKPDLIFLDVQMPKINGFEMLELLEERPAVIFTTAFDEYAIKAFDIAAVDYLLKPFSQDRFDKALQKWRDNRSVAVPAAQTATDIIATEQQPQRVVIKLNNKIKIIPFEDIRFIEAAEDYVMIHTDEGRFMKHKTMAFFEQALNKDRFVRCHRSYIVDVQQIVRLEAYEKDSQIAILHSGAKVPVSKSGYTRLKQILGV